MLSQEENIEEREREGVGGREGEEEMRIRKGGVRR